MWLIGPIAILLLSYYTPSLAILGLPIAFLSVGSLRRLRRKYAEAAFQKACSARSPGRLIEVLSFYWQPEVLEKAAAELCRLLPNLEDEEALRLTERQRRSIYRLLTYDDKGLIIAALKFVERYGSRQAIPLVTRLAEGKGRAMDNDVFKRAESCLKILQDRLAQNSKTALLLRPAEAAPTVQNTLLLPAKGGPTDDTDSLVRPSSANETEVSVSPRIGV